MRRLHNALCGHFNQDPTQNVKLYIHGHKDVLTIHPSGNLYIWGIQVYPKELKTLYLDNSSATIEELIQWIEKNSSILIRINNEPAVFDEQGRRI